MEILIILLPIVVMCIIKFIKYCRRINEKEIKSGIAPLDHFLRKKAAEFIVQQQVEAEAFLDDQQEEEIEFQKKQQEEKAEFSIKQQKEKVKTITIQQNRLVTMKRTIAAFEHLHWGEWDQSVHCSDEQYDRMLRAEDRKAYNVFAFNSKTQNAKIRSNSKNYYLTNGKRCSCPDFRIRNLPCKHMYYLAYYCYVYHESYISEGNQLKGLNFCISGKNQEPVKEYIYKHGGTTGDFSINKTSAVVLSSDTENGIVEKARKNDVEILTFEDLKELFP